MFNFFSSIFEFIEMILDFVISSIEGLISVVINVVRASGFLLECVAFLPPQLVAAAGAVIGISVVYMIVGRD